MSLAELDKLLPPHANSVEEELFREPAAVDCGGADSSLFKEASCIISKTSGASMFKESELLPPNENVDDDSLFKQPVETSCHPDDSVQLPFPTLDIPDFSHYPIDDGNFGDLEFLDLASDRFLSKSKNLGQYSDIYFNSLATPSGYCSANYLTEEANRLSLLLSESNEKDKGESLDKSLIENLEELFGVAGPGAHPGEPGVQDTHIDQVSLKENNYSTIDEQLPNVLVTNSLDQQLQRNNNSKSNNFDVEFQVPNDVLGIMAKNLEDMESLGRKESVSSGAIHSGALPQVRFEGWREDASTVSKEVPKTNLPQHKTITIKSLEPYNSDVPPSGAVAKIILHSSRKENKTKITFSSIDDKEQHSFSFNTSDMRRAANLIRYYNLDNMEALRRLLQLGPSKGSRPRRHGTLPTVSSMKRNLSEAAAPLDKSQQFQQLKKREVKRKAIESDALRPTDDCTVFTPAVSPAPSPPPPVTSPRSKSGDDNVESKSLELSGKHSHKCKQLEEQLEGLGIKNIKILEVKVGDDHYFCCPDERCQKAYLLLSELKLHILMHYEVKPFSCPEQDCTWTFYSQAKLNRHLKSHSKVKEFVCFYNDCKKAFSSKYNLSVHMKSHGRLKEFVCTVCKEKFDTNLKLELHTSKKHSDPGLGAPSYACDFPGCRYVCFVRNHLISHSKYHTAPSYPCPRANCSKQFRTKELLEKHLVKHLEVKEYSCDMTGCGAKLKGASQLTRHKKVHTHGDNVACPQCKRIFTRSDHLRNHIISQHTPGEKPLHCLVPKCEKRFAGRQMLLAHMRKFHKKNKDDGIAVQTDSRPAREGGIGANSDENLICQSSQSDKRFSATGLFDSPSTSPKNNEQLDTVAEAQEDSSNLDFVALLSSVGEDILVQDELSCPEYEITTEIRRGLVQQDQSSMEHLDQAHIQAAMETLEESDAYVLETSEGSALINSTTEPLANSSEATVIIPFEGSLTASIVPENSLPVIETIVQPSNVPLGVLNTSERVPALPQPDLADSSTPLAATSPFPMETVTYNEDLNAATKLTSNGNILISLPQVEIGAADMQVYEPLQDVRQQESIPLQESEKSSLVSIEQNTNIVTRLAPVTVDEPVPLQHHRLPELFISNSINIVAPPDAHTIQSEIFNENSAEYLNVVERTSGVVEETGESIFIDESQMIIMEGLPENREEVYTTIIQPLRGNENEIDVNMTSCVETPPGDGQVRSSIIQPFNANIAQSSVPAEAHSFMTSGIHIPGSESTTVLIDDTANSAATILDIRNPSMALFHSQGEKVGDVARVRSHVMLSDEDGGHTAINNPMPIPVLPEKIEKGQTTHVTPTKNLNHSTINLQDLD